MASWIFIIWVLGICVHISQLWMQDQSAGDVKHPRLERMSGNDGKFWKGSPDGGVYDDIEGIECREYYHYKYDLQGRLSKTEYYRHHEYYEDVWCASTVTRYRYDLQGRLKRKSTDQDKWIYEYTKSGYTETCRSDGSRREDTNRYDAAGNLVYSRLESRYAVGHERETTISYDEQGRKVQETSAVGEMEPYVSLTIDYDEETHTGLEKYYGSGGGLLCMGLSTYDEEWREIDNLWCESTAVSGNAENVWSNYVNMGYWADYRDGRLMEEMDNRWSPDSGNSGRYEAYDYDKDGNCIWNIRAFCVFGEGRIYMTRYEYDGRGRMTDEYSYTCSEVESWEQLRSDGIRLKIENGTEEGWPLRITTTAPDGTLVNQFIYGKGQLLQCMPEGAVCWYTS
ncbi:MAG: hypothetical protein NC399_10955 [Muribaculum sp.]|nr:hypothetical protein [Muribaculum sp.]